VALIGRRNHPRSTRSKRRWMRLPRDRHRAPRTADAEFTVDEVERIFALGFVLEQVHQNFIDLARCVMNSRNRELFPSRAARPWI